MMGYIMSTNEIKCEMVIGWKPDDHGEPDEEILCGKKARREYCCDDCFHKMLSSGDFTKAELEVLYPEF